MAAASSSQPAKLARTCFLADAIADWQMRNLSFATVEYALE